MTVTKQGFLAWPLTRQHTHMSTYYVSSIEADKGREGENILGKDHDMNYHRREQETAWRRCLPGMASGGGVYRGWDDY